MADRMRRTVSEGLVRTVGSLGVVEVVVVVGPVRSREAAGSRKARECQAADVYQVPDTC